MADEKIIIDNTGVQGLKPPGPLKELCTEEYQKWIRKFNIYRKASGAQTKPEDVQVAILLHCMGEECIQIFDTFLLPEKEQTYEKVKKHFDDYFIPIKNESVASHMFFTRDQKEGESYDAYFTELKKLSADCNFGTVLQERMLKDRIVTGIREPRIKDRLLRETGLTLSKAMNICKAAELAVEQVKKIEKSEASCSRVIRKQDRLQENSQNTKASSKTLNRHNHHKKHIQQECCHCGYTHQPRKCPAYGKQCMKCKKLNHFARKCKWENRAVKEVLQSSGSSDTSSSSYENIVLCSVRSSEDNQERDYLVRALITSKGSVEKAKKEIDQLCTMKTLLPQFFTVTNLKVELKDILDKGCVVILPVLTEDLYRIILITIHKPFSEKNIFMYFQYIIILCEYLKAHDFVNGFIIIHDFRQTDLLDLVTKLNPVLLQQIMSILLEGFGVRVKGIYLITQSKVIDLLINVVKQFLSEKISSRIHVVNTLEELHKVVPKDILPVEYGGKEKSLSKLNEDWIEELSSEEHMEYMKMMNKACTDESLRQTDQFNQEYMGTPGSFRKMIFD